jgi:predicted transcriptional regulator
VEGRTFIYEPVFERGETSQHMASQLLHRVFDGAIDQLVASLLSKEKPTVDELARLETILEKMKRDRRKTKH